MIVHVHEVLLLQRDTVCVRVRLMERIGLPVLKPCGGSTLPERLGRPLELPIGRKLHAFGSENVYLALQHRARLFVTWLECKRVFNESPTFSYRLIAHQIRTTVASQSQIGGNDSTGGERRRRSDMRHEQGRGRVGICIPTGKVLQARTGCCACCCV